MSNTDLTKDESLQLEALIDSRGISSVLMALSEICGAKAKHISHNWQDQVLARRWATIEGAIGIIIHRTIGL